MIIAIRGAIACEKDEKNEIARKTHTLVDTIVRKNKIGHDRIISIQFTQTKDLYSLNCAAGLRKYGFDGIPLFCAQEPECSGSMPRVIRVLLTCDIERDIPIRHQYLEGAETLRPDIAGL